MQPRDEIFRQVFALPPSEQACLVYALENHLADQISDQYPLVSGGGEVAFFAELQRRSAAYKANKASARTAEDVMTALRHRQAQENLQ